ncbi:transglycosylase domain-containing protein [Phaeacidiphilus oryzae]|uniref:transglycosylase domain-containing protein n=1 Tax=Phaeacidiphilus oryzae TaxID=348818 RepID=UPI00068D5458|nr:transglycosylase domain-containing protein [Phaeacidiphilus oryzae]
MSQDDPDSPDHPMSRDSLESEDRADGGGPGLSGGQRRRAKRRARKARRRAMPWYRRIVPTWRMVVGGIVTIILACVAAFVIAYLAVSVPDPNALATAQSNVYYYSDGRTVLGRTGDINRESVPIDQISTPMQHAAVSAEDRSFYSNTGIDVRGMIRAGWNVATGKGLQSGSTITQQYVKNYYLNQSQTVTRKIKEVIIALKVDQTQSKDDILAGYLNTSYFGRGAYGVEAAARAYYGVDASQLNVAQASYLATLLQAPSAYDVSTATAAGRQAALNRWNYVLDGQVKLHWLTQAERNAVRFEEPKSPGAVSSGTGGQAGYLIDIADQYLTANNVVDDATLSSGGWRIVTTFDKKDQDALAKSVKDRLSASLPSTTQAKDVRVGASSVDPNSGKVLAAYGGPDYATQPYNDAVRDDIQVGSTFKAFDLAAGLQNNATTQDGRPITPSTYYDGTSGRTVQGLPAGVHYAPPNEDNVDYGNITLRYAMQKSVNAVYAQEAVDAGLNNVRNTAIALGLPENTPDMSAGNPALALGVATPSSLSMADAYATLDAHGVHRPAWSVEEISRNGEKQTLPQNDPTTAITRSAADDVTSVLRNVISSNGTGYVATGLGRPAAGKTGTTDDNKSAWFIGYTPQLTTAVCMFAENPQTHARESLGTAAGITRVNGGSFPAQIWTDYMSSALSGRPVQDFQLMAGTDNGSTPSASPSPSPTPSPTPTASPTPSTPATTPPLSPSPSPTFPTPTAPVLPTAPGSGPTSPGNPVSPLRQQEWPG